MAGHFKLAIGKSDRQAKRPHSVKPIFNLAPGLRMLGEEVVIKHGALKYYVFKV